MTQLQRKELKLVRAAARAGDAAAARRLLAHSIALGHERLTLRRYYLAMALRADGLECFKPACDAIAQQMPEGYVAALVHEIAIHLGQRGIAAEMIPDAMVRREEPGPTACANGCDAEEETAARARPET
ncbi:hypothetical protein [Xanthobacter sediminis]